MSDGPSEQEKQCTSDIDFLDGVNDEAVSLLSGMREESLTGCWLRSGHNVHILGDRYIPREGEDSTLTRAKLGNSLHAAPPTPTCNPPSSALHSSSR